MKTEILYEFTFTDEFHLPTWKVMDNVDEFLVEEAEMQEWPEGWKYRTQDMQQMPNGELRYFFQVFIEEKDSEQDS